MSEAQQIVDWMRKAYGYRIRKEVYDAIERGDWRKPDGAAQPPEGSVACGSCGKSREETRHLVEMSRGHFWACGDCIELCADMIGVTAEGKKTNRARGIFERRDIKDLTLPTTTKEFAQWLRDVAAQVDRIGDRPLQMAEDDVEVGFYYGNPMFPQKPTELHFEVSFASTELRR